MFVDFFQGTFWNFSVFHHLIISETNLMLHNVWFGAVVIYISKIRSFSTDGHKNKTSFTIIILLHNFPFKFFYKLKSGKSQFIFLQMSQKQGHHKLLREKEKLITLPAFFPLTTKDINNIWQLEALCTEKYIFYEWIMNTFTI